MRLGKELYFYGGGLHGTMDSILALQQAAPGSVIIVPNNFSLDVAGIC